MTPKVRAGAGGHRGPVLGELVDTIPTRLRRPGTVYRTARETKGGERPVGQVYASAVQLQR